MKKAKQLQPRPSNGSFGSGLWGLGARGCGGSGLGARGWGLLGARGKGRGQASLEMTIAIVAILTLMLGSVKVFAWLTYRLIKRQNYYEGSRVKAGQQTAAQAKVGPVWVDPIRVKNPKDPLDKNRITIFK